MTFKEQWGIDTLEALEALDNELRVVEDGRVVCCVGFLATFYVRPEERPDVRERLVTAYERYLKDIDGSLVWGADPKTHTPKRLAGTTISNVRASLSRLRPSDDFEFAFHGGANKDDASPYMARALAVSDRPHLSHASFCWPLSWVADRSVAVWAKTIADLAELIGPSHGYAGWGAITHVYRGPAAAWRCMKMFANRFHGLEADRPMDHAILLRRMDRIKGVNWLTILGTPFVQQLGGEQYLRAELGAQIGLKPFSDGVIIQAGPRPLLGDVNKGEHMDAYAQVARVLKPIRAASVGAIDFFEFNQQQTTEWLHRFDPPGDSP